MTRALRFLRDRAVPIVAVCAALAAAAIWRDELRAWLAPLRGTGGAPAASGPAGAHDHAGMAPLPDAPLAAIRRSMDGYERARALLADDTIEGVDAAARGAASALGEAARSLSGMDASHAASGAESAAALARATDLAAARRAFGELSRALVALAGRDARLRGGWRLFECPMAEGYRRWLQRPAEIANPYMGKEMSSCGAPAAWEPAAGAAAGPPAGAGAHAGHGAAGAAGTAETAGAGEIAYWTCPMHTSVRQSTPGTCPICSMDLTPVTREQAASGVILIDAARRQRIGVRTAPIARGALSREIRAVGRVTFDETRLFDVTLRVDGFVERLYVAETGQRVRRGQVLLELYGPDLYAAQQELIAALAAPPAVREALGGPARTRLRLWGLTAGQLDAIAARAEPLERVPVLSPAEGVVVEKDVVEGAHVQAGRLLYRIAALDRVWVQADVYEEDLPHVRAGQRARVSFPHLPGQEAEGRVDYVYPTLDPATRTGRLRVVLDNPRGALRPDLYADVHLPVDLGEALLVPEEAVIYTGPRRLVFLDLGEGRLRPQEVRLGARGLGPSGRAFAVLEGLSEGDVVVTSGNFLVAAESRIRSAGAHWGEDASGGSGHVH